MRCCCSSAAGVAQRGGDRPFHHPPVSHKRDVLCRNVKRIMRTDRNVIAHHKCFHPLTRNKTHVRSQKAVFALTNSAGCCLAVQDLPAPPKAFLMPRKQHFMKTLFSLSLSEWFFFWSLKPEIKSFRYSFICWGFDIAETRIFLAFMDCG